MVKDGSIVDEVVMLNGFFGWVDGNYFNSNFRFCYCI